MATVIKGERGLLAADDTIAVTTYVSGAPVAPASGCLAIYVDTADADDHRLLEISTKLQNLFDRAREINYGKPVATTLYLRVPLDGSKAGITETTTSTDIVQGDVAIGINANVISGENGSILFDSCFQRIKDALI